VTFSSISRHEVIIALVVGTSLGCICGSLVIIGMTVQPVVVAALAKTATYTPTLTPTVIPTSTPTPTVTRTPTPSPTPTVAPTATPGPPPPRTPRPVVEHFMVERPVGSDVKMDYPDPVYLYGTTEHGQLDVHHGEEFENPLGTPLYAVADGTIVTAGSDLQPICGDDGKTVCGEPDPNLPKGYYGNLVVLQLAQPYDSQRVFALYGHVLSYSVEKGQSVKKGDLIGKIGEAGVAWGPHVHFEIRLGVNDYYHTRHPILWMTPLPAHGALAGRYTDAKGTLVRGATVNIYNAVTDSFVVSTETYGRDQWPPVNSDDDMGENFSMGDLPVGSYIARISGQPYSQIFSIQDGKLSLVEIGPGVSP
jgi:murein DD-endopeptidase MepM/ murein hydrolase activator NlpD